MTAEIQSGDSGEPDSIESSSVQIGQTLLNSAWITGPHPAALAEIEVAEEIEPPTPAPIRVEGGTRRGQDLWKLFAWCVLGCLMLEKLVLAWPMLGQKKTTT